MKSIVEEASSIKQAIENGWKRLGEPTIFSVKILERPETNFFGFNTKSAKVALVVEDKAAAPSQFKQQFKHESVHKTAPKKTVAAHDQSGNAKDIEHVEEVGPKWSEQRLALVIDWLRNVLKRMDKESISFETSVADATLYITFSSSLCQDARNERFLFTSISHLIMEMLRNKSKKMPRNMRIVINNQ